MTDKDKQKKESATTEKYHDMPRFWKLVDAVQKDATKKRTGGKRNG